MRCSICRGEIEPNAVERESSSDDVVAPRVGRSVSGMFGVSNGMILHEKVDLDVGADPNVVDMDVLVNISLVLPTGSVVVFIENDIA